MNARTQVIVGTFRIPISAALVIGLATSACAVNTGSFAPTAANHPANPQADEGEIQDPGKSLAMNGDHAAETEHSESDDSSKPSQARFVCPMHADVTSDQPGKCPRCGMALKEKKPAASEGHVHDH